MPNKIRRIHAERIEGKSHIVQTSVSWHQNARKTKTVGCQGWLSNRAKRQNINTPIG